MSLQRGLLRFQICWLLFECIGGLCIENVIFLGYDFFCYPSIFHTTQKRFIVSNDIVPSYSCQGTKQGKSLGLQGAHLFAEHLNLNFLSIKNPPSASLKPHKKEIQYIREFALQNPPTRELDWGWEKSGLEKIMSFSFFSQQQLLLPWPQPAPAPVELLAGQ